MCGLVAVISKSKHGFTRDECDAFDNLLYVDALRGMDSTGVVLVDNKGNMALAKEASAAPTFRDTKEYKKLQTDAFRCGAAMFGHNRAATRGTVTDENAHPFVVDDRITLIHNGTLTGDHKKLADVEVDSHAIAHMIHKHGDNVEAALQELTGAYALIWHDFKDKTINIIRNSQRPLHWVETDKCWIYASEMNMIQWILARYALKPVGDVTSQTPSMLTKFTLQDDGSWVVASSKLTIEKPYTPPVVFKGESYQDSTFRNGRGRYHNFYDDDDVYGSFYKPQKEVVTPLFTAREQQLRDEEQDLAIENGVWATFTEFSTENELLRSGDFVLGTYLDYTYVDKTNERMGYYVYATLNKHPKFIVRIMVPDIKDNEYDILDRCVNHKKAKFRVGVKTWRAFHSQHLTGGFGMMLATSVTPVTEDEHEFVKGLVL